MPSIKGKNFLVTGGAGFVGSNFVERLVKDRANVVVYDNFSTGKYEFIKPLIKKQNFTLVKGDVLDRKKLISVIKKHGIDVIVHLAANPDVRLGMKKTSLDLRQGTIATHSVLEAAKRCRVNDILFSSSSTVYGKATINPTPESYGPLKPISLYAASKLAAEALITSFSHLIGMNYYIYRIGNVVGKNYSHGVIIDLINKLKTNDRELEVLGTGKQKKSYINAGDCVSAMLFTYRNSKENENIFNVSTDDQVSVTEIANMVVNRVAKNAKIRYTGTEYAWPGDVPHFLLDCTKLKRLGFKFKFGKSKEAVRNTINLLA